MSQLTFADFNSAFTPIVGLNNSNTVDYGIFRNRLAAADLSNNFLRFSPDTAREPPLDTESMDASRVIEKFQRFRTSVGFLRDCEKELKEKKEKLESELSGENSLEAKMNKTITFLLSGFQANQEDFEKLMRAKQDYLVIQQKIANNFQEILNSQLRDTRQELDYAESNLLALRRFVEVGVRNMIPEERVRSNLCPICMDREVSRCIVPCGHTCCSTCSENVGVNCMSCRGHINSVIPLFFSI